MGARRQYRPCQAIGVRSVGLEWSGGVYHDGRRDRPKLSREVAVAVKREWHATVCHAKALCPCQRASGDDKPKAAFAGEQSRQPPSEDAIAADE